MQKIVRSRYSGACWQRLAPIGHRSQIKTLLNVMKLTMVILTTALMSVHGMGVSQSISFTGKNVPIRKVFEEIKRQTGYFVFFNKEDLVYAKPVSVSVKSVSLPEFLERVMQGQPLIWSISEKTIMLTRKPEAPFMGENRDLFLPPLRGRVVGANGQPLSGATVMVKGSKNSVLTGSDGEFTVNTSAGSVLIISYVGYESKEISISDPMLNLSVSLNMQNSPLDELIIQAYGTTTKRLNTGNISKVTGAEIARQPVSNPLAAMAGRVPGMLITQGSGVPGSSFQVQIRGQSSIQIGNEPLYVVDGVVFSMAPEIQNNNNLNPAGGNPLNFINPNDISSIEVLKDADATAIYGSRGANGVVLITTKKGVAGPAKIDINAYAGMGKITNDIQYLSTEQYLEMRREAFKNDGAAPDPAIDLDVLGGSSWDPNSYTDWQKSLIGGTAKYSDVQASVSGGSDLMQYIAGAGYHRETAVFPGSNADQKASVHFAITSNSKNKRFRSLLSGNYIANFTTLPSEDLTSFLTFLPPNAPKAYNQDGTLNWADGTWLRGNPYSYLEKKYNGRTTHLLANWLLSYTIAKGLEIKTSFGYTNLQTDQKTLIPLSSLDPFLGESSGTGTFNHANTRSWIIEPQLEYKRKLGQGQLSVLFGLSFQQSKSEGLKQTGRGFSSDLLLNNLQSASNITINNVTDILYKYNAGFGRINYNYKDRYLLNVTARRDGSSRFGPGRQFANFGAAGAGWIFTKENGMQELLPFLSFGKLRASYGTSGNDQMPDYAFLDRYISTNTPYSGSQGLLPASLFNELLAWEQNKKMEAGLELGFLRDRISFSVSYYRNRSTSQLIDEALSAVTGFPSITVNLPATVQNTGLEFMLTSSNISRRSFTWSSSFNLTIPKNKLVAFPGLEASSFSEYLVIGKPLSILKGYQYAGVDPQTGIYQFMGRDGKPTTTPIPLVDDISVIQTAPVFYGGLQNSVTYRQFSLDILFQFVKQKGQNFLYEHVGGLPGTFSANQPVYALNRWQKEGDIAPIQRYNQDYSLIESSNNAVRSDQQFLDASFIRLKNLALSYALPGKMLERLHLQQARIYFQGQNLLTITEYEGYDPENKNYLALPPLRVATLGIQFTF